ncbi:hypothetical protein LNTAR_10886 [Lentisphaera araneosa HTCC2155]|uniref:DUF1501 domain-containing protein n=1 Tax=Lentisphaera araneosa HTCC2155 TaxID=313628 RepID=A6DIY0_9BACT|nr:DUF1501 domain-containing protein [Lentisphaera araneosa]EDM28416.1 hypothetical protein LNTAR_10886 [Lentisphaera araneosa HTCC2155]
MSVSLDRRTFLSGSSVALSSMLFANSANAKPKRKEKIRHFIYVNLRGGPSQMDTFDAKPDHSNGGGIKGIKTAMKNVYFAESYEGLAGFSEHMALVHTSSRIGAHELGRYYVGTGGFLPNPAQVQPGLCSIAGWALAEEKESDLPKVVSLGGSLSAGFLGNEFSPYSMKPGQNKLKVDEDWRTRLIRSESLRDEYMKHSANAHLDQIKEELRHGRKATQLSLGISNRVFELSGESPQTIEAYGKGIGQSFLQARRLIQAGVPSIEIPYGGWDTHQNNVERCRNLSEPLNKGLCQLLKELKVMGLLKNTMVMIAGDFGRTPRINANAGRDHYPMNTPILLIGGNLSGQHIGQSSKDGLSLENAVTMGAFSYSLYRHLGFNPNEPYMHKSGRPLDLCPSKSGIDELMS